MTRMTRICADQNKSFLLSDPRSSAHSAPSASRIFFGCGSTELGHSRPGFPSQSKIAVRRQSRQQLRVQLRLPLDADQPLGEALVQVSQLERVEAKQVQDRRLQIADVELVFADVVADLVGRAVGL